MRRGSAACSLIRRSAWFRSSRHAGISFVHWLAIRRSFIISKSQSTTLRGAVADEDTEAMVIEAIRDDDTAERIILSNDNFLCRPDKAIAPDMLYPKAEKSAWLRQCLPTARTGHEITE